MTGQHNHRTSRRTFLRNTTTAAAATAAFSIVPRHVLGGPHHVPPSEKVNIALIGAGGQGRTNLRALFHEPDAQVIALADPAEQWDLDAFYFKGLSGRGPVKDEIEKNYAGKSPNFKVAEYEDFRVMLEKEKAIDAVLCATPDHLHAYVSLLAMRAGKHVYCEKPLTHNIPEARLVAQVAKETGVSTQMGNQGHSRDGIRQTCEWIWDGVIGPVRQVHAWIQFAGRWNKNLTGKPTETPPLPRGLNWDLWIGPREMRPYHPAYAPVTWRDFWTFGCGTLGDFGCHDLDAPCWALDLTTPESIDGYPVGYNDAEIGPHGEIVYFNFSARGDKPPVRLTWYAGGLLPPKPEELGPDQSLPERGILFIGDKGKMLVEGAGGPPRLLPIQKTSQYQKPAPSIPRVKGHHRDWLDGCKGLTTPSGNFQYAARLTELVLLGVMALRTRKTIVWDAQNLKPRNNVPGVEAVLHEPYRKGWELA